MVKTAAECTREYVYKCPWHIAIQGYQERFRNLPHPKIPTLVGADVEQYQFDSDSKECLSWVIKGYIRPEFPSWMMRLARIDTITFITENKVDHANKTFTIRIRNDSYKRVFEVNEIVTFTVHPENPEWTLYQQKSELRILVWLAGFEQQAQKVVMEKYLDGYQEGRETDEDFIAEIMKQNPIPACGFLESKARSHLQGDEVAYEEGGSSDQKRISAGSRDVGEERA
eukprot:TRINITY_DN3089_c0_g1_i1.p1 TRINITY_DN3089_c0_g1~~TRINITY_DN3089_c0_g1_i1.p1  ORF type:complete len:227 (-),score=67.89 TRINITY_DN3089_c0_g1_i1:187-867(-)